MIDETTEILNKYASCMEEIKCRTNAISNIIKKKNTTGYKYTDTEFICLQFRKILELIALANMVSNKKEYSEKYLNFINHYHAEHILKDIEKINPNFYPIPSKQVIDEKTKKVSMVIPVSAGYLTKDEFIEIYKKCSEMMHASNPFSTPKDIDKLCSKFAEWLGKIIVLLNHHQVQLIDLKTQIWVLMDGGDGKVKVNLFKLAGTTAPYDSVICPIHKETSKFMPSSQKPNKENLKLLVSFDCPKGHIFEKEFDLK